LILILLCAKNPKIDFQLLKYRQVSGDSITNFKNCEATNLLKTD